MKKQVSEDKMDDYVKAYQDKYPTPKRGPKTPEGIANAAKNLLKKTKNKQKIVEIDTRLHSLNNDPSYTKSEAKFFEKRYKQLIEGVEKHDNPQFEGIIHFLVLQEIKLVECFRKLNQKTKAVSELNRIKRELDHGMANYNKLSLLLHQLRTSYKKLEIDEGRFEIQFHKNYDYIPNHRKRFR